MVWAGALVNHPHEMGKHIEMVFKKNSLTPNAASHNTTSWCTDTDGLPEHSPSRVSLYYKGPVLQNIILFFGGSPSFIHIGKEGKANEYFISIPM